VSLEFAVASTSRKGKGTWKPRESEISDWGAIPSRDQGNKNRGKSKATEPSALLRVNRENGAGKRGGTTWGRRGGDGDEDIEIGTKARPERHRKEKNGEKWRGVPSSWKLSM